MISDYEKISMVVKKILYVDDDESQRTSMKRYVSMLGYDIRVVDNPKEALEILKNDFYPLIITDLEMPDMDGSELCFKIRAMNSKSVIYALSGFITEFGPEKFAKFKIFKSYTINMMFTKSESSIF